MSKEEFNKIKIEGEKLLLLEDVLGWEKARAMAVENKSKAFSSVLTFLSKPNPEEIDVIYEEKRYEAFWHVVGTSSFEYKRKNRYIIPVAKEVLDVDLLEKNFSVSKEGGNIQIEGVEHCQENYREEFMIDANTDQDGDFSKYLKAPFLNISSTEELTKDGTPVVDLESRSSNLVRRMLQSLVKPYKADEIINEDISIHELSLYFYPLYTFEYHWRTKDKKAVVAFDGVTSEINLKADKIGETLRKNFTSDDLFEFSKEIAANLVPGGGLMMMMGKKVLQMSKKEKGK
jgi:hypothetical protein